MAENGGPSLAAHRAQMQAWAEFNAKLDADEKARAEEQARVYARAAGLRSVIDISANEVPEKQGEWSIGPIRGRWQPESYTDSRQLTVEYMGQPGSKATPQTIQLEPRTIEISFMVDSEESSIPPEKVYSILLGYQEQNLRFRPLMLTIGNTVLRVYITNVALERTHILKHGQCVRGIITLTMKEATGV